VTFIEEYFARNLRSIECAEWCPENLDGSPILLPDSWLTNPMLCIQRGLTTKHEDLLLVSGDTKNALVSVLW
jgi:hypothetical protein